MNISVGFDHNTHMSTDVVNVSVHMDLTQAREGRVKQVLIVLF